jgi:protease-4
VARYREATDKPIVAYLETAGNKEYYLASACSEVYMAPEGMMFFIGLRFGVTFFKGALEKLGVDAQFARIGQYKSAVEPFTREEMSDSFREMLESLADDLFDDMLTDIAADREMPLDSLRAIVDDPPLTAGHALEVGLVDELVYRDELEAQFKQADEEEWSLVSMDTYAQVPPASLGLGDGPEIAVIYCEGAIMSGESAPPYYGGDQTMGSATITRVLRQARKDEDIEAVVMRVDSPGGSGLASDLIWREVELTSAEKPVVVSMSDYAASGGYYISMGADAIIAQPGTLTGSIGVYTGKFSLGGLFDKVGLSVETVERGEYAGLMSPSEPFSEAEQGKIEGMIESFYDTFIEKAAEGRQRDPSEVDRIARGRVWTGRQALGVGLVDELGGFRTALDRAKELAGIDAEKEVTLVILPEQRTMLQEVLDPDDSPSSALRPPTELLLPGFGEVLGPLMARLSVLDAGGPVAMLPYLLTVD